MPPPYVHSKKRREIGPGDGRSCPRAPRRSLTPANVRAEKHRHLPALNGPPPGGPRDQHPIRGRPCGQRTGGRERVCPDGPPRPPPTLGMLGSDQARLAACGLRLNAPADATPTMPGEGPPASRCHSAVPLMSPTPCSCPETRAIARASRRPRPVRMPTSGLRTLARSSR